MMGRSSGVRGIVGRAMSTNMVGDWGSQGATYGKMGRRSRRQARGGLRNALMYGGALGAGAVAMGVAHKRSVARSSGAAPDSIYGIYGH